MVGFARFRIIFGLAALTSLAACGADVARTRDGTSDAVGQACAPELLTQACQCSDGLPGRQVCRMFAWGACECVTSGALQGTGYAAADGGSLQGIGNDRSDIVFDWPRTEADGLTCEAGHYEGNFAGLYYSRFNWPAPFPVAGVDIPGQPALQFDMLPAEPGETTLKVDGKFDGLADGVFPFRGDFVGELDCATKKFTGMMVNGSYNIGPRDIVIKNPLEFPFEGPVSADYDKITHSFVNGRWDAFEAQFMGMPSQSYPRDPFRDGVGGSGVWSTSWVGKPVDYKCPASDGNMLPLACQAGPFGLKKTFCVYPALIPGARADAPACMTDAECEKHFPGEMVKCTDINGDKVVLRCLKECAP